MPCRETAGPIADAVNWQPRAIDPRRHNGHCKK